MTALWEELEKIKATFAQKNDPSVVAVYEKGIEDTARLPDGAA